jgi:hypothetical protein
VGKEDGKQLSFRIDEATWRRFKSAVAMDGATSQEVLEGFVKAFIEGQRPVTKPAKGGGGNEGKSVKSV